LKNILKLDEKHAGAHLAIAHLIVDATVLAKDISLHQKASDHFKRAEELINLDGKTLPPESLWKWGVCDFYFGKFSEEPLDLKNASIKFKQAFERGFRHSGFLVDYGSLLLELGTMTRNKELFLQSTEMLRQSLEIDGDNAQGWLRLALAYKVLYVLTQDFAYFEKSDHSFVAAARLMDDNLLLWVNWGDLLAKEGFSVRDPQLLSAGIDKLQRALTIDPKSNQIRMRIADATMHLGIIDDDFECLKFTLSILRELEAQESNNIHFLSLYGECLVQLGRYFGDTSYYQEGIKKIEEGLKWENDNPGLWHVLGMAYLSLGDLDGNIKSYDQAAKFLSQANRCAAGPIPEWLNQHGVALMKMGESGEDPHLIRSAMDKFEQAVNVFQRAGGGHPDPEWVYNFGVALDYLGEFESDPRHYERSIAVLGRLLEQYPSFCHVKYNLAQALFHLGDAVGELDPLEKAEELYEELLQEDPDAEFVLDDYSYSLMVQGDLLQSSGHGFLQAKACFEKAESMLLESVRHGSAGANYFLACLYALLGRYNEALSFLERAKQQKALPSIHEIMDDEWFDEMRDMPEFRLFIAGLRENPSD
jgi:tetratricopeptide (TPR) repeat protein